MFIIRERPFSGTPEVRPDITQSKGLFLNWPEGKAVREMTDHCLGTLEKNRFNCQGILDN
jgi:hypothetical protein